jgi:hypothetical protein
LFSNFQNCAVILWNRPTNVRKQVYLIYNYFHTIPDGGDTGYVVVAAQDLWWLDKMKLMLT